LNIEGRKVLVLGGYGLVGMAVCHQLLERRAGEIQVHSLRQEEADSAQQQLQTTKSATKITTSSGDIFGLLRQESRLDRIGAQLKPLYDSDLPSFLLYQLLAKSKPEIVIDCVNTATGIAYRDIYSSASNLWEQVTSNTLEPEAAEDLLEALYVPRLIRHLQILYRGMSDAQTKVYVKVGTSGTGGMGLNVPYTHSEEKPSRVLLSKSAIAGAHSMLLFLMARTPGAPITKEIKPAAAIAWKKIGHGPISRKGQPIMIAEAEPRQLGPLFSTSDPGAARLTEEVLETAFIDTGENGVFSLEEFALLTTARQMEFVTPEEIGQLLIFEIEGGNTGRDIINALDNAVLGPTYRAGIMRHWALERMEEFESEGTTRSVAFEMLGPPRNSKLLFEAHLLRESFGTMTAVRESTAEEVAGKLNDLVRQQPRLANEVISIGVPILLDSGEILRGQTVLVPSQAEDERVTPESLANWVHDGWVDLRVENCAVWIDRFKAINREISLIPQDDTSSRYLRNRRFWNEQGLLQPGKIVGWILSEMEHGARIKR
jgi:hypothetical protein